MAKVTKDKEVKAKSLYLCITRNSDQLEQIKVKVGEDINWLPYAGDTKSVCLVMA